MCCHGKSVSLVCALTDCIQSVLVVFVFLPPSLFTLLHYLSRCNRRLSVRVTPSLPDLSTPSPPSLLYCFHLPTCLSHLFECSKSEYRPGLSLLIFLFYQWRLVCPVSGPNMSCLFPMIVVLWSHNVPPSKSLLSLCLNYLRLLTLVLSCLSLSSLLCSTSGGLISWWPHLILVSNLYFSNTSSSLCLVSLLAQLHVLSSALYQLHSFRILVSTFILLSSWLFLFVSLYQSSLSSAVSSLLLPLTPCLLTFISVNLSPPPFPLRSVMSRLTSMIAFSFLLILPLCPLPLPLSVFECLFYLFTSVLGVILLHLESPSVPSNPLTLTMSSPWLRPLSRLVFPAGMLTSCLLTREYLNASPSTHIYLVICLESLALSALLWSHLVYPLTNVSKILVDKFEKKVMKTVPKQIAVIEINALPGGPQKQ